MGKKRKPLQRSRIKSASLLDALLTTTQQRVLGLFFSQPDRKFTISEVISQAKKGSGAVQREIEKLSKAELLRVEIAGKQKYYSANSKSALFTELCAVILKTVGLTEPLTAALEPHRGQIQVAFVFGSIARGEATAVSDIDLMVIADGLGLDTLYDALVPLEGRLGRKINPTIYSQLEFNSRLASANPFLMKVLKGEKIILLGELNVEAAAHQSR